MSERRVCRVCGESSNYTAYTVREMFLGTGDEFEYSECAGCGSLQIKDVPGDIARYYTGAYFPVASPAAAAPARDEGAIGRWAKRKRSEYRLGRLSLAGWAANALRPPAERAAQDIEWLRKCHAGLDSRILDAGCGGGALLSQLSDLGFRNLAGIDLYIEKDAAKNKGAAIFKKALGDIDGEFDVIMLHHSLEHMEDPAGAFRNIARLLAKKGSVLIRTPVVPSYAWQHYGTSWVQIDAPRHLFVFSVKGIGILAEKAGLRIRETVYDSTELQFVGSEQYAKGIPLADRRSYYTDPGKSIFTTSDIESFRREAAELNRLGTGDQAAVYLARARSF